MKNSPLRSGGRALLWGLLALALLPMAAQAAGENYGRIAGYVYDPTGAPLAEVPLTVSGPALQQPQQRTSDETGRFEFGLLPPGEGYVLEVKVEGFATLRKTGLIVRLGQTLPVDMRLEVLTETEATATYEIVEKVNPILNPASAQTGAIMTAEKAAATPIFNQVQTVQQLVAGVGPGNRPSSRGGLARYGRFYVDGMDTTDVTDGSITSPLNYYAVENFETITGGLDAQYNALGMVANLVTKTGSNRFTYDVSLIASPAFANAPNKFPTNQPSFAGGFTQNESPTAVTNFYSPIVNFGGPLIKDRLWFHVSGQLNLSNRETPLTVPGSGQENRPTDTQTRLAQLKVTWQPTDQDRLSVAFNYDNNVISNSIASASVTRQAEQRIDRGGYFLIFNYDHSFNEDLLFQLSAGTTLKQTYFGPQVDSEDISHVDNDLRLTQFNAGSISRDRPGNFFQEFKSRFQFDPTLTFKVKQHQMKGGLQLGYLAGSERNWITEGRESDGSLVYRRYIDRGGVCDPLDSSTFRFCSQRIDFYNTDLEQAPQVTGASVLTLGAFFQDRWTVSRQLTLVGGLRLDMGRLLGNNGQFITNLVGLGPRVSATYDLFNDRKTLLKAHYGRSNDIGDLFVAQRANPTLIQVTSSFDRNANRFPDCAPFSSETGCATQGGLSERTFARTHTPPSVDEVSMGLHHEVAEGMVLGADATYRRYSNMWVDEELNRVWDPTGTRIIGYRNGEPRTVLQVSTSDKAWREYRGLDLWVQGRNGPWDVLGSYTLGFNHGTVGDYFDTFGVNPRMQYFFEGPVADDIRHFFKGAVNYITSFGLDFGVRMQYLTGRPMWMTATNPGDSTQFLYRSPRGTGYAINPSTGLPDFNNPATVVELRQPDLFQIDAQARYDLGRALNTPYKLELTLLVINVLNNTEITTLSDRFTTARNTTYGTASFRNRPLQAELLLRWRN